jgi:GMP synthase (glutamine-hydrolysing)
MTEQTIRLGIIDTIPAEFYLDGEKSDPQKFIDMFRRIQAPMTFRTYLATEEDYPESLDECDAYLITGSPCSVYDTYTWLRDLENFVRHVSDQEIPLVGICFGHQIIAQSLGGKVRLADGGWTLGLHEFDVTVEKQWMLNRSTTRNALYFINQDQVVTLPPDVQWLGGSDVCPNAMFCREDRILSIQGHPEQPLSSMHRFLELLLDEYHVDRDLADHAETTMASNEPDADLFASWITEFLKQSLRRQPGA